MADYTTHTNMPKQCAGTELVPRTGRLRRTASNGATRIRLLQSTTKLDPRVEHKLCTPTQRNAFVAFYEANKATSFTFVADEDGVSRTCIFGDPPYKIDTAKGTKFNITAYLIEA